MGTETDYLDVILNLTNGEYKPFRKENSTPKYVDISSNHPKSIIRQIPIMVNKRISTLSSNVKVFDEAKPIYQEALDKAGHKHKLEYMDNIQLTKKNRCRTKAKYWYNPPYNMNLKTNIGREFFRLVDKHFT